MSRHFSRVFLVVVLAALLSASPTDVLGAEWTIRSQATEVTLRPDLNGFRSIVDRKTGRDYAATGAPAVGLYHLTLGGGKQRTVQVTSLDAASRNATPLEGGCELRFVHDGETPLEVICRITAAPSSPMVHFAIRVINHSKYPLTVAEFPRALMSLQLGARSTDDRIVYPGLEGSLLCDPARRFKPGAEVRDVYPGQLSAQFMYFFDPDGGFYCAAADGSGCSKTLLVKRQGGALEFAVGHFFPRQRTDESRPPYEVLWTTAGGRWEAGAEIYRQWAEKQPWCAGRPKGERLVRAGGQVEPVGLGILSRRDVPAWLTHANVFLNYTARIEGTFYPASAAAKTFARYREFFGLPLVCVPFGWERNGAWIGPEYFPPFGGEETYIQLARELAKLDSHLQLYTSGFRWGVKKTISERPDLPRRYTDYDGTAGWEKEGGKQATAITRKGELEFKQVAWADNYTLCAASLRARQILAECFGRIFAWGVAGVDLDQNIGGNVADCYSTEHGHPPGAGPWQFQAMSGFLGGVRQAAKARSADAFLGVEEPCEAYIPWLDVYHGRAFTDTVWPARGPGAVSIPLHIYLYHEYQVGYAGWIDPGFSPMNDERIGLGRAFIFGMQPGIRITADTLDSPKAAELLKLLRQAARLIERSREYLLLGRMLEEPRIIGSPMMEQRDVKYRRGPRPPLPVPWPVVQATAWRSAGGNICYALANLSDRPQAVRLEAQPQGMAARTVTLRRIAPEGDQVLKAGVQLPYELPLELKPWEMLCIEQVADREDK